MVERKDLIMICPYCGWRNVADLQIGEPPKEFWCFRCAKKVIPRVVSLRETPAQRRLKWSFYIAIAVFLIVILALAFMDFPRR
jgi:hypothetical protein